MNQISHYKGTGVPAALFFDAKAAEALSLVFERNQRLHSDTRNQLSEEDNQMIENLALYIGNHYADDLSNDMLGAIACMGTTKLKKCFRIHFDCTITEYIQNVRIDKAEHLLVYTGLPIGEVAKAVGYSNAGRFAELFRKEKGILPLEYRKLAQNIKIK